MENGTVLPKTTGMEVKKIFWDPQIHQNMSPEYQEIQGRIFWKTATIILITFWRGPIFSKNDLMTK